MDISSFLFLWSAFSAAWPWNTWQNAWTCHTHAAGVSGKTFCSMVWFKTCHVNGQKETFQKKNVKNGSPKAFFFFNVLNTYMGDTEYGSLLPMLPCRYKLCRSHRYEWLFNIITEINCCLLRGEVPMSLGCELWRWWHAHFIPMYVYWKAKVPEQPVSQLITALCNGSCWNLIGILKFNQLLALRVMVKVCLITQVK